MYLTILLTAFITFYVPMNYAAQDESRVANIAQDEAKCYIRHETKPSAIFVTRFIQSGFKCFVVFYTH